MRNQISYFTLRFLLWLGIALSTSFGFLSSVQADERRAERTTSEDLQALTAFQASVRKYEVVLSHKKSPTFRLTLQSRIAEILYEMSAVLYRLQFAEETKKYHAQYKAQYNSVLNRIVRIQQELVQKRPKSDKMPRYLFLLAQAYKELGKDRNAIVTYQRFIDNYPQNEDSVQAHFALHTLLNKAKQYKIAINYFKKLKVTSDEVHYPLVLNGLAFDYFNLGQIETALKYMEQEYSYHLRRDTKRNNDLFDFSEEIPDKIAALKNIALFYSELAQSNPKYSIQRFSAYLNSLRAGLDSGTAYNLMGSLLRSRGRDREYHVLKQLVLKDQIRYGDRVDFLVSTLEKEVSRKQFSFLKETSDELLRVTEILEKEGGEKLKPLFLKSEAAIGVTVETLQKYYKGTNNPQFKVAIRQTLISLYRDLLILAKGEGPKAAEIHYNLAELYFVEKLYPQATLHYKWIFRDHKGDAKDPSVIEKAHYKAIVSRYEVLNHKKMIPSQIKARSYKKGDENSLSDDVKDWIDWIHDYPARKQTLKQVKKRKEPFDLYYFSMIQLLYGQGHTERALDEIEDFLEYYQDSKYFVPLASLYMDSYFVSQDWKRTLEASKEVLPRLTKLKTHQQFREKIREITSESQFKIIEKEYEDKNFDGVVSLCREFIKEYPRQNRREDALALAGNAALGMGKKDLAVEFFQPLIRKGASKAVLSTAYLTKAAVFEEKFILEQSLAEYRNYLNLLSPKERASSESLTLRKKMALMTWAVKRKGILRDSYWSKVICGQELSGQCEQYRWYETYRSNGLKKQGDSWSELLHSLKMTELRLSQSDRLIYLKRLVKTWEDQDALFKYITAYELTENITKKLQEVTQSVRSEGRLSLDKARIQKRVSLIESAESAIEKVVGLPWVRLQVAGLQAWATLYSDLYEDFDRLPRPSGMGPEERKIYNETIAELRKPFFEKALEYRKKAYELGRKSIVEASTFVPVALAYVKEDPFLGKEPPKQEEGAPPPLPPIPEVNAGDEFIKDGSSALLAALRTEEVNQNWFSKFSSAVKQKNWPYVSFLIQLGTELKILQESHQLLAQMTSLALTGNQAEAFALFEEKSGRLRGESKGLVQLAYALGYFGIKDREKTKDATEAFFSRTDAEERVFVKDRRLVEIIADAMAWSGSDVSHSEREKFFATVGGV